MGNKEVILKEVEEISEEKRPEVIDFIRFFSLNSGKKNGITNRVSPCGSQE
ncbi:MAG: hypothetical protein WD625_05095 [Balneolales bacterium]